MGNIFEKALMGNQMKIDKELASQYHDATSPYHHNKHFGIDKGKALAQAPMLGRFDNPILDKLAYPFQSAATFAGLASYQLASEAAKAKSLTDSPWLNKAFRDTVEEYTGWHQGRNAGKDLPSAKAIQDHTAAMNNLRNLRVK